MTKYPTKKKAISIVDDYIHINSKELKKGQISLIVYHDQVYSFHKEGDTIVMYCEVDEDD